MSMTVTQIAPAGMAARGKSTMSCEPAAGDWQALRTTQAPATLSWVHQPVHRIRKVLEPLGFKLLHSCHGSWFLACSRCARFAASSAKLSTCAAVLRETRRFPQREGLHSIQIVYGSSCKAWTLQGAGLGENTVMAPLLHSLFGNASATR